MKLNTAGGRAGEKGVTLVELLTVMAVLSVVLAFVTGTVVNALRSQRRQVSQVAALNAAKLAFERVTRDIRAADLKVADLDRIRLDVHGPGGGIARTVTYERVADRLKVTDHGTGVSRDLVSGLPVDNPLFLFHLVDGATVTGSQAVDPRSVLSISVRLQVTSEDGGRVLDLINRVGLRNAEQ